MKILLTAASRHGATAEMLEIIDRVLRDRGFRTETRDPESVESLDGYDAVILGSAIYYGSWLGPARDFADRHAEKLRTMPVWLFSSGPVGDRPVPAVEPSKIPELLELTGARGHGLFSGRLDRRKLGMVEKAVTRVIRAPEGDFRDPAEIEAWASRIADDLGQGRKSPADRAA